MAAPNVPRYPTPATRSDLRRLRREGSADRTCLGFGCGAVGGIGLVATLGVVALFQSVSGCEISLKGSDRADCAESDRAMVAATASTNAVRISRLLADGQDPDRADDDGNRPLACAALLGNDDAVDALLRGGADPNRSGTNGGRPIVAATSGEGLFGNEVDPSGPPFSPAGSKARLRIIELLAKAGARLEPALTPAAQDGRVETVRLLLRHGADPDGDPAEVSPLTAAATKLCAIVPLDGPCTGETSTVVDLLLDAGADPNHGGRIDGEQVRLLLSFATPSGAPGVTSTSTVTEMVSLHGLGEVPPLVAAVAVGNRDATTRLLAAHADPNRPAFEHYRPLWAAVAARDKEAARLLLAAGADPTPADREGRPIDLAEATGQVGMARLLREAA